MQSNHTVQADTLRERSLSLARRLLAGAGRFTADVALSASSLVARGELATELRATVVESQERISILRD